MEFFSSIIAKMSACYFLKSEQMSTFFSKIYLDPSELNYPVTKLQMNRKNHLFFNANLLALSASVRLVCVHVHVCVCACVCSSMREILLYKTMEQNKE